MTKAYIIIDLQNDYFPDGLFPLVRIHEATAKAAEFLKYARENDYEVIHVRHVFPGGGPFFNEGTKGAEIHEDVQPQGSELVITKNQPNSFVGTILQEVLDKKGIKELVIAGAMTNVCVQGTVRAASELGYKVQLIRDAVTTRDWEYDGKTVTAEQVDTAVFATLAFGYADLLTTAELTK